MTMTDRELLELSAKAAGKQITGWHKEVAVLEDGSYWQPLHKNAITDTDGDALRLAVKLGLDVEMHGCKTTTPFACAFDCMRNIAEEVEAGDDGDPYAATRRAIVRAAAEIGSAI